MNTNIIIQIFLHIQKKYSSIQIFAFTPYSRLNEPLSQYSAILAQRFIEPSIKICFLLRPPGFRIQLSPLQPYSASEISIFPLDVTCAYIGLLERLLLDSPIREYLNTNMNTNIIIHIQKKYSSIQIFVFTPAPMSSRCPRA